jgi:hypothetical protein
MPILNFSAVGRNILIPLFSLGGIGNVLLLISY